MLRLLRKLLSFLKNNLKKKKSSWGQIPDPTAKKGLYNYNEETKQWEYAGKSKVPGKIPMCLHEFLTRKHHSTKGSWRRPVDERYAKPLHKKELDEMDFGKVGCKNGNHYIVNGRCNYCGREKR